MPAVRTADDATIVPAAGARGPGISQGVVRRRCYDQFNAMSYCEHCEGQRFDRARVLRLLRQIRKDFEQTDGGSADEALDQALQAIRTMDVPHLEWEDASGETVH